MNTGGKWDEIFTFFTFSLHMSKKSSNFAPAKVCTDRMQLSEVIGQSAVKTRMLESLQAGRIAHAQLLTGPAGVGKLPLALAYAQLVSCEHRTADDACGECASCRAFAQLQHPDLHLVFPITTSDSLDKPVCDDYVNEFRSLILETGGYFDLDDWHARLSDRFKGVQTKQLMIYERESSEILRKLSLMSFSGGWKTVIIWLPERMNETCANKLLKILEEPPADTLFLLVSDEPQKLLPTILSRVQRVEVPRLSEDEIVESLRTTNDSLSFEEALDFAHMANGSLLRARKLAANDAQNARFLELFQQLMRNAWSVGHKQDYDALVTLRDWSQEATKMGRDERKAFLDYCMSQVRENYISNYGEPEMVYQTHTEREFSSRFARFVNDRNVEGLLNEFSLAQRQIEQNANAGIVFFDLAMQMIVLIK